MKKGFFYYLKLIGLFLYLGPGTLLTLIVFTLIMLFHLYILRRKREPFCNHLGMVFSKALPITSGIVWAVLVLIGLFIWPGWVLT